MTKICKHCKEPFKPTRRNNAYCGNSCQNKAYYDRRVINDPLYSKKVYQKRNLAIKAADQALEARTQRALQEVRKKKEEQQKISMQEEERQKRAVQEEEERQSLKLYNQALKEEAEQEQQRQLEKEITELKAQRERKKKAKQERTQKSIEDLVEAVVSLLGK